MKSTTMDVLSGELQLACRFAESVYFNFDSFNKKLLFKNKQLGISTVSSHSANRNRSVNL